MAGFPLLDSGGLVHLVYQNVTSFLNPPLAPPKASLQLNDVEHILPWRKICKSLIQGEMSSSHFIKCQVTSWHFCLGTHRIPNISGTAHPGSLFFFCLKFPSGRRCSSASLQLAFSQVGSTWILTGDGLWRVSITLCAVGRGRAGTWSRFWLLNNRLWFWVQEVYAHQNWYMQKPHILIMERYMIFFPYS